ncbi:fibronectin type III domain-containing protein [Fodinicola feengrottensis]|uniref:fibronectin type III domain-containing protein n=1 Tax=Fodinicola feengrottensis TaxID=435914 RepID=UPI0013D11880|nr:fibronectin type III domain-containing protein [Fodinicola feengrottensis]
MTEPAGSDDRKLVASTARRSRRGPRSWRRSLSIVTAVAVGTVLVAAAFSGAVPPVAGMQFHPTGHWVYDTALQTAFHVDGATTNVDARVPVAGDAGSQVVQSDTDGYVVGGSRIVRFGKSNLKVQSTVVPPSDEVPLTIESVGGPYLVYRQAGKIVRLGTSPVVIPTGDRIGDPVVTADGTMWLLHSETGLVCTLPKAAVSTNSCPARVPAGHSGALTVIADKPRVLDTTAGVLRPINPDGLGAGLPVGVPTSATTQVAPADAGGKVALLDAAKHALYLVDPKTSGSRPITVDLPPGQYDGPLSGGSVIAVVNKTTSTVTTYDIKGQRTDSKQIPVTTGAPKMTRGADGQVYVQDGGGSHLLVVGKDGKVADVPVATEPVPTAVPSTSPSPGGPASPSAPPSPSAQPPQPTPHPEPTTNPEPPARAAETAGAAGSASVPEAAGATERTGCSGAVAASAGSGSATVTWNAAAANRATIGGYLVSWSGGSTTVAGGGARRATVSGLTNGQSYTFSVAARNSVGLGPAAGSNAVTPAAAASAPGGFTATASGNDASLSWSQPNLGGGTLQHYTVTASGIGSRSVAGTSTSYSGLRGGQVTFTVRAVTTVGGRTMTGAAASRTVTIAVKNPKIFISRGSDTHSSDCKSPNCSWINMRLTGFAPNTRVELEPYANGHVFSEPCVTTTDSSGAATCDNDTRYDVPDTTVYVYADTADGRVQSNTLYWERR